MLIQGFITECSPLEKSGVVRTEECGFIIFQKNDIATNYSPLVGDRVQLEVFFENGCHGMQKKFKLVQPLQLIARADLVPNSDCG